MRRRVSAAVIVSVVVALALAGLGTLVLSRAAARRSAEADLRRQAGVVADLAAQEHHRLDHTCGEERLAAPVPRLLVQHVRADRRERQSEQPVVQVREPDALREPSPHDDHDATQQDEIHGVATSFQPVRSPVRHLPILPAGGAVGPGPSWSGPQG